MTDLIVCPLCRSRLNEIWVGLACAECEMEYLVLGGIPIMLTRKDQATTARMWLMPAEVEALKLEARQTLEHRGAHPEIIKQTLLALHATFIRPFVNLVRRHRVPSDQAETKIGAELLRIADILDMDPRMTMTARNFGMVNGRFGFLPARDVHQNYVRVLGDLIEQIGFFDGPVNTILEVGCGNLLNLPRLRRNLARRDIRDARLMGFDYGFNRVLLGRAFAEQECDGLTLWCGDAKAIALPDKSVDFLFTTHVLETLTPCFAQALEEIRRVAKYVAFLEPIYEMQNILGKLHNYATDYPRDWERTIRAHGFEILETRELGFGSPLALTGLIFAKAGA